MPIRKLLALLLAAVLVCTMESDRLLPGGAGYIGRGRSS